MIDRMRGLPILLAGVLCVALASPALFAQTKPPAGETAAEKQKLIEQLRKRIAKLEQENADLRKKQKAAGLTGAPRVIAFLESMYYGSRYYSTSQPKFFAARVLIVNLSRNNVTIKRDGFELSANGKTFKVLDVPNTMRYSYFYIGTERHTLGELKIEKELTVKPGGTASTWVVFLNLGKKNDIPRMSLKLKFDKQTITLDVNAFSKERLGMKVERIGPRGGLGLVTISGRLDSVSVGSLVDAVADLAKRKIVRVVIRWTKSATPFDSNMQSWIINEANQSGRTKNSYNSYPFPDITATVRELHLAQIPNYNPSSYSTRYYGSSPPAQRIHKLDIDAVSAALKSAYQVLPTDELIKEIETGHPLTRAAALANGGGRLPSGKLPLVLKYADDKEPRLQLAALKALSQFGEDAAVAKLVEFIHHKSAVLSNQAIVSLASSRYAAAHRKLLAILKSEPLDSKKKIVRVVAAHPRPIWSETIYEFAKDGKSGIGADALKALGRIGHPKLVDVLEDSLKSSDANMRNEAFSQLASRGDQRSEKIAVAYTLAYMKKSAPTSQMYSLIKRTKDQQFLPLLLEQLDKNSGNQSAVIDTIATIGDQKVGDQLANRYSKTKSDYEKSYILRALIKLRSPKFRKLAGEALMSRDSSLISAACDGLREDAGREAVKLLVHALEKSTYTSAWSYTASSLGQIGTPEARKALIRARNSKDSNKRSYAISALHSLMQQSPGYQYIYRANSSLQQKNYKQAIEFYNLALKLDNELAPAYSGRGHALLKQKNVALAKKDFAKAAELDPYDMQGVSGSAILLARDGKHAAAVKKIESIRNQYSYDRNYLYNAARVYSLASAAAAKEKNASQSKVSAYQKAALKDLSSLITRYRSYYSGPKPDDVKKEDDFKPLRNLPEYKKLIDAKPAKAKNSKTTGAEKKKE